MEFTTIQFLFVTIFVVVVTGRNELKFPELSQAELSQNVSETGVEGFEAMETGNFTCDFTLDPRIEPSCCQERQSDDYGSGCFYFMACNGKRYCAPTAWFYPVAVMSFMLVALILCCPVTFAIGRFCFKHLRQVYGGLFGGRSGGRFGGSDAKFEMKNTDNSPIDSVVVTEMKSISNNSVVVTEAPSTFNPNDDNIDEDDTPKEVEFHVEVHRSHPLGVDYSRSEDQV